MRDGEGTRGLFLGLGFRDSLETDFLRAELLLRGIRSTKPSSSNSWAATLFTGLGCELFPPLGLRFGTVCSRFCFVVMEEVRGVGGGRDEGGDGSPSLFVRSFLSRDSLSS